MNPPWITGPPPPGVGVRQPTDGWGNFNVRKTELNSVSEYIIDLSHDLNPETPVCPGDPGVEITVLETTRDAIPGRRALNNSRLATGTHCGTHMDAPFHFFEDRATIDQIPLERFCGRALRVDLRTAKSRTICAASLQPFAEKLREHRKVVLHTGWASHWGKPQYFTDHPVLSRDAALFLVDSGVHLVGLDTPSVDLPPFPAHLVLLGNGVVIVENLRSLEAIPAEVFELIVLPLRIAGRDGSPVRAIGRLL